MISKKCGRGSDIAKHLFQRSHGDLLDFSKRFMRD